MKVQLLIDGLPGELIQVLQMIEGFDVDTTTAPALEKPPIKRTKKAEPVPTPAPVSEPTPNPAPQADAETSESKPDPEPSKPTAPNGQEAPPARLDLATIRKAFGERFTNEKTRDKMMELLKSTGYPTVGEFYQKATDEQKREFYNKITQIPQP